MSSSGNVIDLQKHRNKKEKKTKSKVPQDMASITDITEMRQEIIAEERRGVKRTLLTEFIGLHLIVPNRGLTKCVLYDISENGLAFEMPTEYGQFKVGEMVALRVYLNHQTYFPFVVKINNVRYIDEEGVYRFGGAFQKETINEIALFHFSKFIENVSAYLKTDHGDVLVSNLGD
ncbi:PilZ domain-containing protein [bacterium]|nr:PilZ domain-containing protein [bacterium]